MKLLFSGVGPVSASDVALASASGATILAFNVRQPPPAVEAEAKRQGIQICTQRIIYRLLEEVRAEDLVLPQGVQPSGMQQHKKFLSSSSPSALIDHPACCSSGGRPDGRECGAGGPGGCVRGGQRSAGAASSKLSTICAWSGCLVYQLPIRDSRCAKDTVTFALHALNMVCRWQVFPLKGSKGESGGAVAGCRVSDGTLKSAMQFRVLRDGEVHS